MLVTLPDLSSLSLVTNGTVQRIERQTVLDWKERMHRSPNPPSVYARHRTIPRMYAPATLHAQAVPMGDIKWPVGRALEAGARLCTVAEIVLFILRAARVVA